MPPTKSSKPSVVTETVEEQAKRIFDSLDTDKDGKLTYDELNKGLRAQKLPHTKEIAAKLITKMDRDDDNLISLEEFQEFSKQQNKALRALFDQLDRNHNGLIEIEEVQESINKLGLRINPDEIPLLMKRVDKDRDEAISFSEWTDLLMLVPEVNVQSVFRYWGDSVVLENGEATGIAPLRKPQSLHELTSYLCAGTIAGAASRTGTAPLERLKVIYQIHTGGKPPSMYTVLSNIYKEAGIKGFWQGNGANILKVAPETGIKFVTYEFVKRIFRDNDADLTVTEKMIAGAVAGVVTHSTLFPLEVIKTRLVAAPAGTYKGIFDVAISTALREGPLFPFYRGLSASLLSTIPHSSIHLTVYETLKQGLIKRNPEQPPVTIALLGCAAVSTVCGQIVAYPFHVVKSRIVTQGTGGRPILYKGVIHCFQKTWRMDGWRGFYRGLLPTLFKSVPAHGITLVVYEYLKRFGIQKSH